MHAHVSPDTTLSVRFFVLFSFVCVAILPRQSTFLNRFTDLAYNKSSWHCLSLSPWQTWPLCRLGRPQCRRGRPAIYVAPAGPFSLSWLEQTGPLCRLGRPQCRRGRPAFYVAPASPLSLYVAGADRPSMSSRQTTMSSRQTGHLCRSG